MWNKKLEKLAEIEGLEVEELLEEATYDSVCMGICKNKDCDYTTEVEPDQDRGWCEECKANTVVSPLMLAGII
jgi:hypothetical protein